MRLVLEFDVQMEGLDEEVLSRKGVVWRAVENRGLASAFSIGHGPDSRKLYVDGYVVGPLVHLAVVS